MNSATDQTEPVQKTNRLAKISLIFGLLGIFPITYWFNWNFLVFQIVAVSICLVLVITGIVTLIRTKNKSNKVPWNAILYIVLDGLGAGLFLLGGNRGFDYIIVYFYPMIAALFGLIGVITGVLFLKKGKNKSNKKTWMSILGIVLGSLGLLFFAIFCIPYYACSSC